MMQLRLWVAGGVCLVAIAYAEVASASAEDRECLGLAMYWEARGEGQRGMTAVGSVVMNRVASRRFPDSVCGVVFQGGERPPCQFSWWCDGKSDRPRNRKLWRQALSIADDLLSRDARDPTRGALYFHSRDVSPSWQRSLKRTARIGNHLFYR